MARLVQRTRQTVVDARPVHDQPDLDDPLPDHPRQLRLRVRSGVPGQAVVVDRRAIRRQPRGQPALHADLLRAAKCAAGCGGHPDRVGNDYLDDGISLACISMGCCRPSAVFRVGVDCDGDSVVDHGDELD